MSPAVLRVIRFAAVLAIAVATSAHVGSPNVFFTGRAGPYDVSVVVRPPDVIPGLAEVTVRIGASGAGEVRHVLARPVHWTTGSAGSPPPDTMRRVDTPEAIYSGTLWLMTRGAYTVQVTVDGPRGAGSVAIPVAAVATARRDLGVFLGVVLAVLGTILFVGMATIVRAAASEALIAPGQPMPGTGRRRGRIAMAIAIPVLALAVLGGWRWWTAEARAYERTLYRPLAVSTEVTSDTAGQTLTLSIRDSAWRAGAVTPLVPDHGKMMHMFVIRAGTLDAFAHLHPSMKDANTFVTRLPPLPSGRYDVFADVVHESGMERTLVSAVEIPTSARASVDGRMDRDDGWSVDTSRTTAGLPGTRVSLGDGSLLVWRTQDRMIVAGRETMLRFEVSDSAGAPVELEPYLGMSAHAVVARDDGSVFVHLHPMGTVTTAAQLAFAMRDRGDTTAEGRLAFPDSVPSPHHVGSSFAFPYAFPREGRYRVWVQVRRGSVVRTGSFLVYVAPARPAS